MEGLRITDAHVHVQPWDQLKPHVRARMAKGRADFAALERMMREPASVLERMDEAGVALNRIPLVSVTIEPIPLPPAAFAAVATVGAFALPRSIAALRRRLAAR